ncbi:MAG: 2-amino-4-hydroxy-6-hydroxymethyldihydropteridine diphosphokinase [Solirubrobacteraceae bacterium]|nr:2-amino-4-hydroxy-6-hydroxymethyldihydropteridine diphosphokinase [Solirubrobacteraceae bacterium]
MTSPATPPSPTTPTRRGYLGLGSNVGDRRAQLQAAVDLLPGHGVTVLRSSSSYDTDPVGVVLEQDAFLNAALEIETALDPLDLLDACKAVEQERGRALESSPDYVRHGPRALDVDLLLLGDEPFSHERLTLPHAQVLTRRFVMIPLLELDFDLVMPGGGRVADALAQLPLDEGVRRAGDPLTI